jgi:hypothetical protein
MNLLYLYPSVWGEILSFISLYDLVPLTVVNVRTRGITHRNTRTLHDAGNNPLVDVRTFMCWRKYFVPVSTV